MEVSTAQWAIVSEMCRRHTGNGAGVQSVLNRGGKPVYGPLFSDGEYFVCPWDGDRRTYRLVERISNLHLSDHVATPAEAIAQGRAVITTLGPWLYASYLEHSKQRNALHLCRTSVALTIATVSCASRPIGRRRRAIFEKGEGRCHYCAAPLTLDGLWHVEHRMPKALGGTNEPVNLVPSCAPCNFQKRDRTDIEFIALLAEREGAPAIPQAEAHPQG